jgi:hypothetical protein
MEMRNHRVEAHSRRTEMDFRHNNMEMKYSRVESRYTEVTETVKVRGSSSRSAVCDSPRYAPKQEAGPSSRQPARMAVVRVLNSQKSSGRKQK